MESMACSWDLETQMRSARRYLSSSGTGLSSPQWAQVHAGKLRRSATRNWPGAWKESTGRRSETRMNISHSRVLITGGAGFVGSHLADQLLGLGCKVTVLDNLDDFYGRKEENFKHNLSNPNYKF